MSLIHRLFLRLVFPHTALLMHGVFGRLARLVLTGPCCTARVGQVYIANLPMDATEPLVRALANEVGEVSNQLNCCCDWLATAKFFHDGV
jgi:hypothetical protein